MVLVGIEEQLGRHTTQDGCVESAHSLAGEDAIVALAVDAEDGRVPGELA